MGETSDSAEVEHAGIVSFLDTKLSKADLSVALKVLRAFKECESSDEWLATMFIAWTKLEQLEEFLEHLVDGEPLKEDTLHEIERVRALARKRPPS